MTDDERRGSPRRNVRWPIWVSDGREDVAKGETTNVSRSGAYFLAAEDPSLRSGMIVSVRIEVPAGEEKAYVLQTVSGEARVVRLAPETGGSGVALHFSEELDPFNNTDDK